MAAAVAAWASVQLKVDDEHTTLIGNPLEVMAARRWALSSNEDGALISLFQSGPLLHHCLQGPLQDHYEAFLSWGLSGS